MGRASNGKWIQRAERVVNLRRSGLTPAIWMYTWRRPLKFWRAMLVVLARPVKVARARGFSPLKTLQSFFNRPVARQGMAVAMLLLLVGAPAIVEAQTACTPVPIRTLAFGTPGQSIVPAKEDTTSNLVPHDKLWIIKAAGIGQGADPGVALEYRLQIDHQWPDRTYWYTAVEVYSPQRGTPVVALTRNIILEEGERVSARSNGMPNGGTMYVMALGWELPASCLSAALGLVTTTTTTTSDPPLPPPDFSALIAAAGTLQTAAAALQAAIPR